MSTDDCVVYDLTEKVWNFRFGTWRGRETGRADISFIRFELCVCFPFLLHSSSIVVLICCRRAIPRYNKEEIDNDIDGVRTWIDKTKDEL